MFVTHDSTVCTLHTHSTRGFTVNTFVSVTGIQKNLSTMKIPTIPLLKFNNCSWRIEVFYKSYETTYLVHLHSYISMAVGVATMFCNAVSTNTSNYCITLTLSAAERRVLAILSRSGVLPV